jgi:hypothetical protein
MPNLRPVFPKFGTYPAASGQRPPPHPVLKPPVVPAAYPDGSGLDSGPVTARSLSALPTQVSLNVPQAEHCITTRVNMFRDTPTASWASHDPQSKESVPSDPWKKIVPVPAVF